MTDDGTPAKAGRVSYRLGTTSYIKPDAILPNVRWLKDYVQDVELVLFEVDDGPNNLPKAEEIRTLIDISHDSGLTYTVHLPLDLDCRPSETGSNPSLEKAARVIECTLPLQPQSFIVHLDGRDVRERPSRLKMETWTGDACRTLEKIATWSGSLELLAIENLEGYPTEQLEGVLARLPVSRCLDIGHLWLDGLNPRPLMEAWLPRTRVIHLHGIKTDAKSAPGRSAADHQSLAQIPHENLQVVADTLLLYRFAGVVTLEVFNEADLLSSKEVFEKCQRN